jgi:hypothetical protein
VTVLLPVSSHFIFTNQVLLLLLSSEEMNSEKLSNLPKVTELAVLGFELGSG